MRKRRHLRRRSGVITGIDLAPMLDFVINLLIFFIITAVFVKESGLRSIGRRRSSSQTRNGQRKYPDPDPRQRRDLGRQPRRRRARRARQRRAPERGQSRIAAC